MTEKKTIPEDWFESAFGDLYNIVYAHRSVASAAPEARFAAEAAGLSRKDTALDLCCGTGRHLATLMDTGASLTGYDYSPVLLAKARQNTRRQVHLVRGDMRYLPFTRTFSVIFSFFTSFGYFMDDGENKKALLQMSGALAGGGRFFFDYLNPEYLKQNLVTESTRDSLGFRIREQRWIDEKTQRVNKTIRVEKNNVLVGKSSESVRMYTFDELRFLLEQAGLRITQTWGNYDGTPYSTKTPRMLVLGIKGAA